MALLNILAEATEVEVLSSKITLVGFSSCLLIQVALLSVLVSHVNNMYHQAIYLTTTEVVDVALLPATLYKAYLKEYKKDYNKLETMQRFQIFKNSLTEISRLNHDTNAIYGLTKFADVASNELFGTSRPNVRTCEYRDKTCVQGSLNTSICEDFHRDKGIPDKFDWREKGVVGPVLNQKMCNGCWAFGIVGVMESMAAIHNIERDVRRSIQELIDCSDYTQGCTGGHVARALQWLCVYKWGVVTEDAYPLKLVTNNCTIDKDEIPKRSPRVKHYCQLCDVENEEDILRLVYFHGPVMVVVNAEPWRFYIDGVIQMSCFRSRDGLTHDHVVQIVGYDRSPDTDVPHYIVRNSWGEDFGDGGYVKLEIGNNICGVADEVSFFDVYFE